MKKYNRTNLMLFALLAALVMVSACAANLSTQAQVKSQSIVIMDTYHAAYVDVKTTLESKSSTVAQREMAVKKRAILVQIWNILGPYEDIINQGGAINAGDITAINSLIDQLAAFATTTAR